MLPGTRHDGRRGGRCGRVRRGIRSCDHIRLHNVITFCGETAGCMSGHRKRLPVRAATGDDDGQG